MTLIAFEASVFVYIGSVSEGVFELAQVFEEGGEHECLLILVDGYLCDFEYEVEEEEGDFFDVVAEDLKDVSEFLRGDFDEVELTCFALLHSDEVFAFHVVVFAQQLQEFEGATIGRDAQLVVEVLVCGVRLEDVFTESVFLHHVVVVVVVDCVQSEFSGFFLLATVVFVDVFSYEFAQFEDECFYVLKDLVLLVFLHLLDDVFLSELISS